MKENDVLILAVESSCDETAAAVVKNGLDVLSNIVASQIDLHRKYGGVVPEIASRKHLELINPVIEEALQTARVTYDQIDGVAATYGPGLVGGLLVGLSAAKALAYVLHKPFIGVNHIAGHIYANFISNPQIEPPVVCLTISGGHTDLLYFKELGDYQILGRSRDDAAGEAFDKIARVLEIGYPGGPAVEKISKEGDPVAVDFPRPFINEDNYDFSFSGLKTAVINYIHNQKQKGKKLHIPDIAASFQQAVIDVLLNKVMKAVQEREAKSVILSGGVAANKTLRQQLSVALAEEDLPLYTPSLKLCTDNAAMIGAAAYYQYQKGDFAPFSLGAAANLSLK
ncbi:tRNA (adenosine(37)-N6)-threonylcarbamoyltransferase complex transferase subunit TsaD [Halocella sp. SP3-1]|uniref:tRNA (adenosine(37)-N6)-threonylcarbamoyltransferase complex transferase subunit TsaD n=1 Tax=Halocella sp. SP3-1 TaxID=2382161 RepID=UPI000F764722|nr:tRNA (adenosine(37)-N6)-threonylcarbamoyltransferase complex transferase subunit TsaD [Halocella sp. SP3-1]AZO96480.1 tRNA (adenosine(37)-N6)-threonylcarbamoyltransferase complex transferase subunit TsaD [Halocella sp. SP3-1]